MKYVAQFRDCAQIGPDDFEMRTRTLPITENTTAGEIIGWYRKVYKQGNFQLTITETEELTPAQTDKD